LSHDGTERITNDDKAAMPLQERRRKLKEQFERILGYLAKENPEKLAEFKAWEVRSMALLGVSIQND
jgi:hypothetical protein